MEEELRALLQPLAATHWGMAPQGSVRPFIVLRRVSGGRSYTTDGREKPSPTRVQADVYGATYGESLRLGRRLVAQVSGRKVGTFQAILVESEQDLPAADAEGNATEFRTSVDLIIHQS